MTWIRCPVQPQRDPAAGQRGAHLDPVPGQVSDPAGVDIPVDSTTVPPGRAQALAGLGAAGGGSAGLAPRIFSAAMPSASRHEGTVLAAGHR
jgi:hypothetical protein